jgi:PncC family amidohydrolase
MKFYIKENDSIQLDQILKAAKIMDNYILIRREIAAGKVIVNGETKLNTRTMIKVGDRVSYKNSHIKVLSYATKDAFEKEPEGNVKHGKGQNWLLYQTHEMTVLRNKTLELSKKLQKILLDKKKKIAFAESCTGGLLQEIVTFHPGASAYYIGGIVCYSNEVKTNLLQVPKTTLQNHGAVSKETASAMMQNVQKIFQADIGISITGIAGPSGGTRENPVGTVYFAIGNDKYEENYHFQFNGNRESIRLQVAIQVLNKLNSFLKRF